MSKINSYRDLEVWRDSMDLVVKIYNVTGKFPVAHRYVLSAQMQRAALSIPSNIAEGQMRFQTGAYMNYLSIALGSSGELSTQIQVAAELGLLDEDSSDCLLKQIDRIGKRLRSLHSSLEKKRNANRRASLTPNPNSHIPNPSPHD